jgi:hypothetical protein
MMRRGVLHGGVTVAVLVAATTVAHAEEREVSVRLEYRATAACPDAVAFADRLRARSPQVRFVADGDALSFDVRVSTEGGASGTLVVRRGDAIEGRRQVLAGTCNEVADALAFAASLAIEASTSEEPAPITMEGRVQAPPAPQARRVTRMLVAPDHPPSDVDGFASTEEAPVRRPVSVGAAAAIASNTGPGMAVGVMPYVGWSSRRDGWIDPSVRFAFLHTGDQGVGTPVGASSFWWTVGLAEACVLAWPAPAESALRLHGCARLEAGKLDVEAPAGPAGARPWFAAGPLVRRRRIC